MKKTAIKVIAAMVLCLSLLLFGKNTWNTGVIEAYAETDATGEWEYETWDGKAYIRGYNGKKTEIDIPEEVDGYVVKGIEDYAFEFYRHLKSVTFPETLTSIGTEAFRGCSGLTSISIPKNVNSFGSYAFDDCSGLESIVVDKENKVYDSRGNCNAIIDKSTNELLYGCKNTVIPKGVKKIGESAFGGCKGLTNIAIPDGVTEIGQQAFEECSGLKNIAIPDSVKKIGSRAFSGCSSLTSITIPEGITEIQSSVFYGCRNIKSIYISANVKKINLTAFAGCAKLSKIIVDKANKFYDSRNNCNAIIEKSSKTLISGCKNTVIPNGIKKIGFGAFYGCSGLKSIKIPQSVTEIEGCAFTECKNLKSVTLPEGLKTIGREAFWDCSSLKSIVVPESVTEIEYDVFKGIKGLVLYSPKNSAACKYAHLNNIKWEDSNSNSIDDFVVSLSKSAYKYDGKGKKPSVTLEMGSKKLKKGSDYTVKYEDNVSVGKAKVIITGTGNYRGTVEKTFTIEPSQVKEVKQKASYSKTEITLTWKKMPGADGYEVYRATSEDGTYKRVAAVKSAIYKNFKLETAKTYYYKVCAYESKVKGEFSDVIAAGTKTEKPTFSVVAGGDKATLAWEEVTGADGYEVYMKTGKSGKYKKVKNVKAGTTVYTKSKLTKGKNYSFKIRTYRMVSGKKVYSDWSSVKKVSMK